MKPQVTKIDLLLTALTPISHHDPAVNDGSNMLTFNRQKQKVSRQTSGGTISQEEIDAFCQANPVPLGMVDIFGPLKFSEFIGTALVRTLIDLYNSPEGTGLFSGMERYAMLETRLRSAAVRSFTLPRLWSLATKDLQLPIHGGKQDERVTQFFALPIAVQESAITAIIEEYRAIVTIARVWSQQAKMGIEEYAAATGQSMIPGMDQVEVVRFNADDIEENHGHIILEVPSISSNSLRHQAVRFPGWQHLVGAIGLTEQIPVGAEAIFVNGGNIKAGAKQPQNAFGLAEKIRQAFPSLDLLGGVTNSFDIGESRLSVASWLVCRENADALKEYDLPGLKTSAYDLLDNITHTRQATEHGVGQMIYNFEALATGTQVLTRLVLKPFTPDLTRGALLAAIETYLGSNPVVAGQSARGYGHVSGEMLGGGLVDGARELYENYLAENAEQLKGWMMDGTLGCGQAVTI